MAKSNKKSNKTNEKTASNNINVVKTATTNRRAAVTVEKKVMPFGKENYKWIGFGVALIALGMILMLGGYNENPAVWDESKIYGFQRITLAPIVILSGLAVQVYAIFR